MYSNMSMRWNVSSFRNSRRGFGCGAVVVVVVDRDLLSEYVVKCS